MEGVVGREVTVPTVGRSCVYTSTKTAVFGERAAGGMAARLLGDSQSVQGAVMVSARLVHIGLLGATIDSRREESGIRRPHLDTHKRDPKKINDATRQPWSSAGPVAV